MKVISKGHTTVLKDTQGDSQLFLDKVTTQHESYKNQNLILDLECRTHILLILILKFLQIPCRIMIQYRSRLKLPMTES